MSPLHEDIDVGQFTPPPMRTYALINGQRVMHVIKATNLDMVLRVPGVEYAVDITDIDPALRPSQNAYFDGHDFTPPPNFGRPVQDLSLLQASARAEVEVQRRAYVAQFVTDSAAKFKAYQDKSDEVDRYDAANGQINPAHYPYLSKEATCTGRTLAQVVAIVRAKRDIWLPLSSDIESAYQGFIHRIDNATVEDDISAVFPLHWPTP